MPLPRCPIPILTVAGLIEIAALQPADIARSGDRRGRAGLGGAFMENLVYDGTGSFGRQLHYLIPTATDFRIRAIALENHPSTSNPLGVKGAGEGAIIPVGGLMANAVAAASLGQA